MRVYTKTTDAGPLSVIACDEHAAVVLKHGYAATTPAVGHSRPCALCGGELTEADLDCVFCVAVGRSLCPTHRATSP